MWLLLTRKDSAKKIFYCNTDVFGELPVYIVISIIQKFIMVYSIYTFVCLHLFHQYTIYNIYVMPALFLKTSF